jgi:putative DNA primase/helicase
MNPENEEAPFVGANKELRETLTAARDAYATAHCNGDNVKGNTKIAEITLRLQPDFGTVTSPRLCEKPELARRVLAELTRLTAHAARPSTRSRNRDVPKEYAPLTVCGSDVKIEKLEFFWPGLMPWGYPFLLGGDPGLNKSTLTVDTAARASRGEFWPCSTERAPIVNSLFITAEDGVSDVIMPRYLEAGGDPSRVFFMKGKVDTDGRESGIDLRLECIPAIEKAIRQHAAKLVVIDPVSAYLAGIDSHNDAEVRAMLLPVQEIAARNKCVIVLVLHFNKDGSKSGLHRFMGSVAFSAVCRAAFGVVKDRNDPKKRLFLPIKANLAPDTRGLEFYVNDSNGHPKITWGADFSNTTIDEALMPEDHQSKQDRAMLVIKAGLATNGGEMASDALLALTQSKKIGLKATYAALKDLKTLVGLERQPSGFGGKWIYALPKVGISTNDDFDAPYAAPTSAAESTITAVPESVPAPDNTWTDEPSSAVSSVESAPVETNGHGSNGAASKPALFDVEITGDMARIKPALASFVYESHGHAKRDGRQGYVLRGVDTATRDALLLFAKNIGAHAQELPR